MPEGGKVSPQVTERARMGTKRKNTAIRTLFARVSVSLRIQILFYRARPLRRWRASSPKGRALGEEEKLIVLSGPAKSP